MTLHSKVRAWAARYKASDAPFHLKQIAAYALAVALLAIPCDWRDPYALILALVLVAGMLGYLVLFVLAFGRDAERSPESRRHGERAANRIILAVSFYLAASMPTAPPALAIVGLVFAGVALVGAFISTMKATCTGLTMTAVEARWQSGAAVVVAAGLWVWAYGMYGLQDGLALPMVVVLGVVTLLLGMLAGSTLAARWHQSSAAG